MTDAVAAVTGRNGDGTATTKADKKAAKKAAKKAKAQHVDQTPKAGKGGHTGLTPARAKRAIGVGKVVAPLLAPYALAAAGVARAQWDAHRARKLGVAPDQLSTYSGRGGALHARLSRVAGALTELDSGEEVHATGAARRFALDTRPRLADLAVAVRAAEQMPAPRRRTAFRAISGELDRIETQLLTHLGIRT